MVWLSLTSLALALSMDAMAVGAARGLSSTSASRVRDALSMAIAFGGAQALMPVLGWLLGEQVGKRMEAWDHWIASGLLSAIGAKMLWEAFAGEDETKGRALTLGTLLLLALATSIDAFAAGITLPLLELPLVASAAAIGTVTAALSFLSVHFARALVAYFGKRFGNVLEVAGGVVLIGLGLKVLAEHLFEAAS